MGDTCVYRLHLENKAYIIYQALLSDVKNTKELREQIFANKLKCCLIKPSLIVDPWIVAVAANKAIDSELSNTMTTKSVYTEILYNLSSSKNISESLKQFGVQDGDTDVLAVLVTKDESGDEMKSILNEIHGSVVPLEDIKKITNEKLISKLHGISEKELTVSNLFDSILSHMSYKEFK